VIDVNNFWEVPGFWQMVFVLTMFASAATLCICFGPDETAGTDEDSEDQS
jgi:hypothetical protein